MTYRKKSFNNISNIFKFFKRRPKIITFQNISSKDLRENPGKALLAWMNEMDKYVKVTIVIGIILIISTPIIINNLYTIQQKAAKPSDASSTIVMNEDSTILSLGSSVTFTTKANGLKGREYPMIYLVCTQNQAVVYGQLDHPDVTFILGGGSSQWKLNGGSATCKAYLYAYGGKDRGNDTIRLLAETSEFETN
ncbi:MAG: hypothetical protein A2171_02510 [Candidatus Levybacteria bacterium RBG_13_35_9]|nr:MAG: hypothetical protein A2171_02510 [Candidatus Levybacteria bacterium RBG_13_35_9]